MKPRIPVYACAALAAAAFTTAPVTATASGRSIAPVPAALAGHRFSQEIDPLTLAGSTWNDPFNAPGDCPANPSAVSLNSSGYAELSTTGAEGNCTSIQSPQTMPTTPGYVYEADVYFSNFEDWPAFWMYGSNWPAQGEIDAVEANYGVNYVTWHYAPCSSSASNSQVSTNPWTYACKTTVKPFSANISPGWHIVDIAFTYSGVQVYYDGSLYVSINENVTTSGNDPMWVTFSEGSCAEPWASVCASGAEGVPGNVQVKYLRIFT
jgi:hypothetical protein